MDYITFPKKGKIPQVSKMEMEKLRVDGGLKLINISLKSLTPKVHWLIRLITDETLKVHLHLFNSLMGVQKGQLRGQDIIFAENSYVTRTLKTRNSFYKEKNSFHFMSQIISYIITKTNNIDYLKSLYEMFM